MSASDTVLKQLTDSYTDYADDLYRFCYTRTLNEQDAWDLVQDAFVNLHGYLADGKTVENFRVFLFQVTNNLIIDRARLRKRRHDKEVPLEALREFGIELSCEDEVHGKIQKRMEAGRILQMVRGNVSADDYNIFILRYINGLMPTDIAKITGLSSNGISVKLHRMTREVITELQNEKTMPYPKKRSGTK